jgi:hypothetical protein
MVRLSMIAVLSAGAVLAGCTSGQRSEWQDSSAAETRANLEEQVRFQQLRQRMRSYAREVALTLPIACDAAVRQVPDVETQSDVLALAASGGIYAIVRCSAADPRVGLADLTVTFSTVLALFQSYAREPEYKGLAPVVDALQPIVDDYEKLAEEWLPADVMAQVRADIETAIHAEEARIRTSSMAATAMAATVGVPASLQIHSSFLSFNDNGLIEFGLGEAHYMRLSAQELADCMELLPSSLDYHSRRSALWVMQQPAVKNLEAKLDSATSSLQKLEELQSLRALQPLDQLHGLTWKLGSACVLGLAVQGAVLALVLRRRA